MKKKNLVVFGTRPEAIKMYPVVQAIKQNSLLEVCVCVTGQHRERLRQVLDVFNIDMDYDLHIMKEKQTPYDVTYAVIEGVKEVIKKRKSPIGSCTRGYNYNIYDSINLFLWKNEMVQFI